MTLTSLNLSSTTSVLSFHEPFGKEIHFLAYPCPHCANVTERNGHEGQVFRDGGIQGTLSEFADNTKLCGGVGTLEGRDAIQRDLDRPQGWEVGPNPVEYNKVKSKVLHGGHVEVVSHQEQQVMHQEETVTTPQETSNLGIELMDK
ncbi:hypothetical protein DUI87_24948 [Hirundo rustica rustica]|uniref:Uncharacterized protein n=1 Tax=Hirundo rustica rustica TaxID=333673 RepID=A0A3M0JJ55_HIRRU|nr:hypothetical protein DUI87_24948 [Hirundo rustica rustica]